MYGKYKTEKLIACIVTQLEQVIFTLIIVQ